jgi:hypothetical protein
MKKEPEQELFGTDFLAFENKLTSLLSDVEVQLPNLRHITSAASFCSKPDCI